MSHFCVAVHIPANNENLLNSGDYLRRVLQPWHEYESTGIQDEYVRQVDVTDYVLDQYLELKEAYIDPDGESESGFLWPYQIPEDKLTVRRLTPEETENRENYKLKDREIRLIHPKENSDEWYVLSVPERYIKVPRAHCHIMNFLDYAISCYPSCEENIIGTENEIPDYGSYIYIENGIEIGPFHDKGLVEIREHLKAHVRVCEYTNPNSKWDWWEVGGRWRFSKKDGTTCDKCQIKDLQLSNPAKEITAKKIWDIVMYNIFDGDKKQRDEFSMQYLWGVDKKYLELFPSEEAYAKDYAKFRCYAFVKDGVWHEPGEMGWWGVSGATGQGRIDYNAEWDQMIENCNPEDWLICVDCHI